MWQLRLLSALLPAAVVQGSFKPLPFHAYRSAPSSNGGPNVRRFHHDEAYRHQDGSDLSLVWEVDVDPDSLMSVDLSHARGARVLECKKDRLMLRVPNDHAPHVQKWQHVVASAHLHGCRHMEAGEHLYHRVLAIESVTPQAEASAGGVDVALRTKELASAAEIFPHLSYEFRYLPWEAKDPRELAAQKKGPSRRLQSTKPLASFTFDAPTMQTSFGSANGFDSMLGEDDLPDAKAESLDEAVDGNFAMGSAQLQNDVGPTSTEVDSVFNLNAPKQLSNLHWNWDYDANCTHNPEFDLNFPGGQGWVRLYKPYLKAHFGISINHTSSVPGLDSAPKVDIVGVLQGWADMALDIATAVDFQQDADMDPTQAFKLPFIGGARQYLKPIKFFIGGTPITFDPGFSCNLNLYHVGQLHGSLRVSLDTKLNLTGVASFSTKTGLQTNFSAKAVDVKFTPPTWMVFTKHFELGVVLEPEVWLKGNFASMKNMKVGFGFRPFLNVSIMQKGYEVGRSAAVGALPSEYIASSTGTSNVNSHMLVIYPYRITGLPTGVNYAVKVTCNGKSKTTNYHRSIDGVIDYSDKVSEFDFGSVTENTLVGESITVALMEEGKTDPVGQTEVQCSIISDGECSPGPASPIEAMLTVSGHTATVLISTAFMQDPVAYLTNNIKGLEFAIPKLNGLSTDLLQKVKVPGAKVEFHLVRNGKGYMLPMVVVPESETSNGEIGLESAGVYDLGLRYVDAWMETSNAKPEILLYVNGVQEGKGSMPFVSFREKAQNPVPYGMNGDVGAATMVQMMTMASNFYSGTSSTQKVPISIAFSKPGNAAENVATGTMMMYANDPSQAAYWIKPYSATSFKAGETRTLYWTTHMSMSEFGSLVGDDKKTDFTIGALDVATDGTKPIDFSVEFKSGCSQDSDITQHEYIDNMPMCVFSYNLVVPQSLVGHTVLFKLSWKDTQGHLHKMLSPAVTIKGFDGRRLQYSMTPRTGTTGPVGTVGAPGPAPPPDFGWQNSQGVSSQADFASHLQAAGGCDAAPLEYSVGFGVLERTDVSNMLPLEMVMEGARVMKETGSPMMAMMEVMTGLPLAQAGAAGNAPAAGTPQYGAGGMPPSMASGNGATSPYGATPGYQPGTSRFSPAALMSSLLGTSTGSHETSYTPLVGDNFNASLTDLLPESICSGGLCSGELPGCKEEEVKPIKIKQIVFKLSRTFKVNDILEEDALRDALAYGLALMPEAVQVSKKGAEEVLSGSAAAAPIPSPALAPTMVHGGSATAAPTPSPTLAATMVETTVATATPTTPMVVTTQGPTQPPPVSITQAQTITLAPIVAPPTPPPTAAAPVPAASTHASTSVVPTFGPTHQPTRAPTGGAHTVASHSHVENNWQNAPPADVLNSSRRLAKSGGVATQFDTIVVTITKPMRYKIDEPLLGRLIKNGAFSLISDGREATHGPVNIASFYLRDRPDATSRLVPLAVGGAAVLGAVTFATVAFRKLRWNDYTVINPGPYELA